ncbi:hypothetical protein H0H93_014399, partial [Arthromyces matolae]
LRKQFNATKEVILSAGVIGTPQVLMNSGIGESTELRAVGIEPIIQLRDVGKNFSDHPIVLVQWLVNPNGAVTIDDIIQNSTIHDQYLQQWKRNQTGPFTTTATSFGIWGRIPDNSTIFDTYPDPSSGRNSPHFELLPMNGGFAAFTEGQHSISMINFVVSPTSRGSVTLNTPNPFDPPLINPNYMSSPFDLKAMRASIEKSIQFFKAPAWKDYILSGSPVGNFTTDEDFDNFILNSSLTGLHGVGTAAMSAPAR